ncbi:MAG: hypothetical protein JWO30_505 [Fibrobacteres bacterium]|nr:hypothetical protein [Fibrobacterota bacterium]
MAIRPGNAAIVLACGFACGTMLAANLKAETGKNTKTVPSKDGPAAVPAPADTSGPTPPARKQATVANLRRELDTLGRRIDDLKRRAGEAGTEAKRETREELQSLERARDRLSLRLDSLGRETSAGWENLKDRAGREVDSLKAGVDRLRRKIKG